jgi:hypothetical protein
MSTNSGRKNGTISRRTFTSLAATLPGFFVSHGHGAEPAEGPSDKLNIAVVGIGGQGAANLGGVKSQNIVALCDVDETRGHEREADRADHVGEAVHGSVGGGGNRQAGRGCDLVYFIVLSASSRGRGEADPAESSAGGSSRKRDPDGRL